MTTFAAIPAKINQRISEMTEHEYWGDDFAKGNCTFLIATKESGNLILVCTFGDFNDYLKGMNDYDRVVLQHTQSSALVYTEAGKTADVLTIDNVDEMVAKYGNKKIPTWTLK